MISDAIRFMPRKSINTVNRCIRSVVAHAYKNVPCYRHLYDQAGIHPSAIKGIDDLPRLPIISRRELMEGGVDSYLRHGANLKKLTIKHTTGTTGNPVIVYTNKIEMAFRMMTIMATFSRNAKSIFPLTLLDIGSERKDSATQTFRQLGPVKIIYIFRDMPIEQQIDILVGSRPTYINGRPSVLWQLASTLLDKNIVPPTPRAINTGAEMLFRNVRILLEKVFRCRVYDNYNCEEVGNLAWQCPDKLDRMHPNTATACLEVVDCDGIPAPYDTNGHLVVTNLYNYTMPFIRYSMGDRGVILGVGKCSCGFNGPLMSLTEGRDENFIVLPDGREITPRHMYAVINTAFPHDRTEFNMIAFVRTFQIIQESFDLIMVKIVPGPAYSEKIWIEKARQNLIKLHPKMRLNVELVDDLTPPPGKKFHQVLGKLSSRWKKERINHGAEPGQFL